MYGRSIYLYAYQKSFYTVRKRTLYNNSGLFRAIVIKRSQCWRVMAMKNASYRKNCYTIEEYEATNEQCNSTAKRNIKLYFLRYKTLQFFFSTLTTHHQQYERFITITRVAATVIKSSFCAQCTPISRSMEENGSVVRFSFRGFLSKKLCN